MSWQTPAEGEILADKFRVERVLGQGGMGVVVAAMHLQLDQRVAIKFLLPEATEHPEIVERFAREARAAARMQGKNVVRIIDVGSLPDGRTFMVMEYLEGSDLEHVLEKNGALPLPEALSYFGEALEALAEAHAKGIVHRDLKPGNLFLANQPDGGVVVKVLDFGISKLEDDRAQLTRTSTAMGTAFYMTPEQLTNAKDVDERADVWSMGIILYELLTNQKPFDGTSMPEIVAKILRNKRTPLTEFGLPAELDEVLDKCLASDRVDRFSDVGELAAALAPFAAADFPVDRILRVRGRREMPPASRLPASMVPAPTRAVTDPSDPATGATQLAVASSGEVPSRAPSSSSWLLAPALAIVVLGGVGAWWWKSRTTETEASTTTVLTPASTAAPVVMSAAPPEPSTPTLAALPSEAPSSPPPTASTSVATQASAAGSKQIVSTGGKKPPPSVPSGKPSSGSPGSPYNSFTNNNPDQLK